MWLVTAPRALTVTELRAESLTEPGAELKIEPRAGPETELEVGPAIKPGIKPAEIEELLVLIAFITVINVSLSELHDLIKTYNDKKQANHHSKLTQKALS